MLYRGKASCSKPSHTHTEEMRYFIKERSILCITFLNPDSFRYISKLMSALDSASKLIISTYLVVFESKCLKSQGIKLDEKNL